MKINIKILLPILCLVVTWLVFISPYLVKNLVPFPSRYLVTFFAPWSAYPEYGMPVKNNAMPDIITQIYPWRHLSIESLKEHNTALWNPFSFSGTVLAGNYQSAPFFPGNILLFMLPFLDGWSILILLQPLLAGIGMILYLRLRNVSMVAAVFGAIAFMFCGFMTTWMAYGTLDYAVLVLPYLLYAIEQTIRHTEKKRWFYGIVLAVAVAFSFFAGHFQMSLYSLFMAVAYIIYRSIQEKKMLFFPFLFLFAGVGIALPQLVTSYHAFSLSNRVESFITNAGIPFHYLITAFAPDFFGNPVTRNDWFGQYAEWSSFIGVIPLLFAFLAIAKKETRKKGLFFILASVFLFFLALHTPISTLFYQLHIPVLSTSVATRTIVLISFSFSVLAAFGFDWLFDEKRKIRLKDVLVIVIPAVLFLFAIWVFVLQGTFPDPMYMATAKRNIIIPTALLLMGMIGMCIRPYIKHNWIFILSFLLVILTCFDLYRFASKWMPFDERAFVFPQTPVSVFLSQKVGNDRVFGNAGNEFFGSVGLPSIEGYDAMYQERYAEFISAAADGTIQPLERSVVTISRGGTYTDRWLSLLGTKYILHKKSDGRNVWVFPHWNYEHYKQIYQDDQYEVLEHTQALPREYLVSDYQIKTDAQEIIHALTNSETDIAKTVVLETQPDVQLTGTNGSVTVVDRGTDRVKYLVETDGPQILVVSDAFDPGWRASINGKEAPILRANYAFRAVVVPEGSSTITFQYIPQGFWESVFVSVMILSILGIGLIIRKRI